MNIETLLAQLARKFRGASLDDIQGLSDWSLFGEAATNLLSEVDPYETVRLYRFNQFGGVYDYEAPEDLKSKKVIDPRPQDGRHGRDVEQTYTKDFDRDKEWDDDKVSVEYQDGLKILRLSEQGRGSASVDTVGLITGWSAAGGATALAVDGIQRLDNSDSLGFNLGALGGYVENSSLSLINLGDHEDVASEFRLIYLPEISQLTSVTLRLGSSSADYWTLPGVPHLGEYRIGVNLVRFDWYNAASTGTPDSEVIEYERLTFVTTNTLNGVRIGPLWSRLPAPWETPYYSNCLFRSEAGAWLETPEDNTDIIQLEKEALNLFFYEVCRLIAEDLSLDEEAAKFYTKLYGNPPKSTGLYGQYKEDKPTEKLRPHTKYIQLRNRRDRRGVRRR